MKKQLMVDSRVNVILELMRPARSAKALHPARLDVYFDAIDSTSYPEAKRPMKFIAEQIAISDDP